MTVEGSDGGFPSLERLQQAVAQAGILTKLLLHFLPSLQHRVGELAESEALLDEIWSYAALTENVWQQQWQPFDLIIWDNRRVLHRRDNFDQNARRLMKRCQVLTRL